MEEITQNSDVSEETIQSSAAPEEITQSSAVSEEATQSSALVEVKPASEERKAYGTAKTENLRDSGAWRIILPTFVALLCVGLLAVPLIILVPLFVNSLDVHAQTHFLTWLWVSMIVLEVGIAAVIIRGLLKIFVTQAGNYLR